jgi:hypothetical protein
MLLGVLTIFIMVIVTYAFWQEGALTAFTMMCNVFVAGLVAFSYWEPIAAELDPLLAGTILHGYEDSVCLVALFSLTLGLLRLATNNLANRLVDYHPVLQQGGSVICGLMTGYLASGFLLCVLQTLPWHRNFMGFEAKVDPDASGAKLRRVLPADRVWLALMHRAGLGPLAQEGPTFDADGSFEDRYQRYRREGD